MHAFSINLFSEIHADQNSSCTEGFLSDQALRMIATPSFQESNPVFEHSVSTSSAHSSRQHIIPSMMIATSGLLTKWMFAARFNHNGEEGSWPELQIWRKSSESGTQYTKISGTSMEPRPITGYLNVYEYDLSKNPIEVKAGDVLGIYQPDLEDTQYMLGFLADSSVDDNIIDVSTNYIMYDVDLPMQEVNIMDRGVQSQDLLPLIFAEIQGKRSITVPIIQYN